MASSQASSVVAEFERTRPDYLRFTEKLEVLLGDLLRAKGIEVHLLESRTKDVDSFQEKLSRSSKTYDDPLRQVTDLVGLRAITYYQDEALAIAELIEAEFCVDRENSTVHATTAAEFGYRSNHYVVRLSAERAQLLEWKTWKDLPVEIQVRTVLQHAWAAISHKLQYKREEDAPAVLKRKLFRLSALFELADDEFVSLREASGEVTRTISAAVASGNRNLPLDYISLSQLLEASPIVAELCAAAAEAGFDFDSDAPEPEEVRDTVSDLIQLASLAGFSTIQDFETSLSESLKWAREYLTAQYMAEKTEHQVDVSTWYATPAFICELLMIRIAIDKIRLGNLLRLGFERKIGTRVYGVAKQFRTEA